MPRASAALVLAEAVCAVLAFRARAFRRDLGLYRSVHFHAA